MDKYIVKIKQEALDDLELIFEYMLSEYSLEAAQNQDLRFTTKIRALEYLPFRNRPRGELDGNMVHRLNVDKYRVFYIVANKYVIVQRVVDMKQNFNLK